MSERSNPIQKRLLELSSGIDVSIKGGDVYRALLKRAACGDWGGAIELLPSDADGALAQGALLLLAGRGRIPALQFLSLSQRVADACGTWALPVKKFAPGALARQLAGIGTAVRWGDSEPLRSIVGSVVEYATGSPNESKCLCDRLGECLARSRGTGVVWPKLMRIPSVARAAPQELKSMGNSTPAKRVLSVSNVGVGARALRSAPDSRDGPSAKDIELAASSGDGRALELLLSRAKPDCDVGRAAELLIDAGDSETLMLLAQRKMFSAEEQVAHVWRALRSRKCKSLDVLLTYFDSVPTREVGRMIESVETGTETGREMVRMLALYLYLS